MDLDPGIQTINEKNFIRNSLCEGYRPRSGHWDLSNLRFRIRRRSIRFDNQLEPKLQRHNVVATGQFYKDPGRDNEKKCIRNFDSQSPVQFAYLAPLDLRNFHFRLRHSKSLYNLKILFKSFFILQSEKFLKKILIQVKLKNYFDFFSYIPAFDKFFLLAKIPKKLRPAGPKSTQCPVGRACIHSLRFFSWNQKFFIHSSRIFSWNQKISNKNHQQNFSGKIFQKIWRQRSKRASKPFGINFLPKVPF